MDILLLINGEHLRLDEIEDRTLKAKAELLIEDLVSQVGPLRCDTHGKLPRLVLEKSESNEHIWERHVSTCCSEHMDKVLNQLGLKLDLQATV